MISNLKKCKTCGFRGTYQDGSPGCSKFKIPVNPDKDYCSWHYPESSIIQCDICKATVTSKDILIHYFGDKILLTCNRCHTLIGTCHTCIHQQNCGFITDHSEPQVVTRTIRQGMMTMQTQIKNPTLVQRHCINCKCSYGTNGECLKEVNGDGCQCWSILPELLQ